MLDSRNVGPVKINKYKLGAVQKLAYQKSFLDLQLPALSFFNDFSA